MSGKVKTWLFVAVLALLGADKAEPEPAKKGPPKADIRGKVTSAVPLRARDLVGRIGVEGVKEKDTQYDKAVVTIPGKAKVLRWLDGKEVPAKFSDLKVGSRVQCVFTGPVRESYPVQASAAEVLILEGPAKK
jgi:hypothetical protein